MKIFLALLFIAGLTVNPIKVEAGSGYYKDVTSTAAPSSDKSAAGSHAPNAQEYIDTARTGQAAPVRMLEKNGRCRDADGVWLHKNDMGYSACVRDANRVEQ